jgi:hypothetical protein
LTIIKPITAAVKVGRYMIVLFPHSISKDDAAMLASAAGSLESKLHCLAREILAITH